MYYRILGPLEAFDGERRLTLGGTRQRAVLVRLLLRGNEAVASDMIVDELWGENPPQTAAKVLQNCVSALRKELPGGAETLRTVGGGYALRVEPTSSTATASSAGWPRDEPRSRPARPGRRPSSCGVPSRSGEGRR